MIAYVKGILMSIEDQTVIVDVHGIGYEIHCSNPFVFQDYLMKEIKINTYHYVREDLQVLYGFKNEDEKNLFIKLISVSGIGPKGALAILGSANIKEFVAAVEREDDKFLTGFPGVGKKTARQIILDLKGKLATVFSLSMEDAETLADQVSVPNQVKEAKEALKALGFLEREINGILPQLKKLTSSSTDELVRKALGLLMKN